MRSALILSSLAMLSACPSPEENPAVLWLALDGRETAVRLVPEEPEPY